MQSGLTTRHGHSILLIDVYCRALIDLTWDIALSPYDGGRRMESKRSRLFLFSFLLSFFLLFIGSEESRERGGYCCKRSTGVVVCIALTRIPLRFLLNLDDALLDW